MVVSGWGWAGGWGGGWVGGVGSAKVGKWRRAFFRSPGPCLWLGFMRGSLQASAALAALCTFTTHKRLCKLYKPPLAVAARRCLRCSSPPRSLEGYRPALVHALSTHSL